MTLPTPPRRLQVYTKHGSGYSSVGRGAAAPYSPTTFNYGPYGTYWPDASTSGIPAGSPALTVVTGTSGIFKITTPGAVFDLIDFQCEVQPWVPGIVISRSRIRGNTTRPTPGSLLNIGGNAPYNSGNVVTIYDSVLAPTLPSIWWNGISNHDYVAHRCNISGVVDPFGVWGSGTGAANAFIYGCYTHDQSMFSPDPNHANDVPAQPVSKTHNDCIQWQGGFGLTAVGNNFAGYNDLAIGEANYSQASPNPTGGGPNNPSAGPGFNFYWAKRPNINGGGIQVSGLNGGNCAGMNVYKNRFAGANRVMTLSQSYPALGTIHDNIVVDDQMAGVAMNIPTGMDTGGSLVMADNYYEGSGLPIRIVHT